MQIFRAGILKALSARMNHVMVLAVSFAKRFKDLRKYPLCFL